MTRIVRLGAAVIAVLVMTVALFAQIPTTLTQSSPTKLDATVNYATSATSAATITLTPPSGNYVYINQVTIDACAGAAVTGAAPTSVTTTGLGGGTTPAWTIGSTSTAGICNPTQGYWGGIPLKSNSPGGAVTIVLPTFATNQTIRANVWYYFAP